MLIVQLYNVVMLAFNLFRDGRGAPQTTRLQVVMFAHFRPLLLDSTHSAQCAVDEETQQL